MDKCLPRDKVNFALVVNVRHWITKKALSTLRRRSEYLKTDVSLWNRIKCFFVGTTLEEFNIATISGDFGFAFEELWKKTWAGKLHYYRSFFWFSKCFASTRKRKAGVFKFLRFQERFRKVSFSWRISLNSRPNCRTKAAFLNFSGVVRT